ncbi:MAG: hypothetical protein V3T60_03925 [Candidatus Binatia bacterium]
MSRAFVSWISSIVQDIFGQYGKIASLFFDQLVIQVPRGDLVDRVLESQAERIGIRPEDADELRQIWVPVQKFLPSYEFLQNPWQHENKKLIDIAYRVTVDDILEQYPNSDKKNPAGFEHEVGLAGAGLVEAVATWGALHAAEQCAFLADSRESTVIEEVFQTTQPPSDTQVFQEIVTTSMPDFTILTWQRVLELRRHPFLQSFRRKISELGSSVRNNNEGTIKKTIGELELHDLRELARLVEPSPRTTILKSIGSNIPLPIPVNPVSIGIGIQEIKDTYERRQRFGWLYFLMELRKR